MNYLTITITVCSVLTVVTVIYRMSTVQLTDIGSVLALPTAISRQSVTVLLLLHGLQVLDQLVVRVQVPPLGPSGVVAHRVLLPVSRWRYGYIEHD